MIPTAARVGLVLGGGGVLGGAWEAGALQALMQETGWDPRQADYLVGTSVGALMASFLAADVFPGMDLVEAAAHRREAFPWPIPGSWRLGLHGIKERGARRWIMTVAGLVPRGALSTQPIQASVSKRIPAGWPSSRRLWITATDYRTGERVVFGRSGAPAATLPAAVAASCALPGLYQPVEIGGRLYADGGLYSAANLDLLMGADIDLAICLNPTSSAGMAARPRTLANRLQSLAEHTAHRSLIVEADALRGSGMPVLLIEPGADDLAAMGLNLMSTERARVAFDTGLRTVAGQVRSFHLPSRPVPVGHRS
jgi:NTE family protein